MSSGFIRSATSLGGKFKIVYGTVWRTHSVLCSNTRSMKERQSVQGSSGLDEFIVRLRIACFDRRVVEMKVVISCHDKGSTFYSCCDIPATGSCGGRFLSS